LPDDSSLLLASPHVGLDLRPDVRAGLLTRRTFRTFLRRPVAGPARAGVLDAARWGWTAADSDPVRLIVLDDPDLKRRLFALTRESKAISNHWEGLFRPAGLRGYVQHWTATPFCIAVCADPAAGPTHIHNNWNHHLAAAAAAENLALAARAYGMALVMYSHFSQEKLKRLLDVPFSWDTIGVMGVGWPDLRRTNPKVLAASLTRLPLAELVAEERYGASASSAPAADAGSAGRLPELLETVTGVRWVTRFRDEPVPMSSVIEILRAGQWAPSAGNFQPVRYVLLRDRARLARLADLARESVEISAHWAPAYRGSAGEHPDWRAVPLAIALISDPTKGGPHIHGEATHMHAGGLAAQNMAVMAHGLGLGTTLVTHWIEEQVKTLIDCPRAWDLVGVMPFGVPAERPPRNPRPLNDFVDQDRFGRPWRAAQGEADA
jgi:nitroreductase